MIDKTNITELAEFFPGCSPVSRSKTVQAFPFRTGETLDQAKARAQARTEKILTQIAARKSAAADRK